MSTIISGTATVARVATSGTVATLLAAIAAGSVRHAVHIVNESSVVLYVKFGSAASATDYTIALAASAYYETQPGFVYQGIITGTLASATGNAQVTSY